MLDLLGDLIDWVGDLIGDIDWGGVADTAATVAGGALLISGVISVASLTYDSIRSELRKREELKKKGAVEAVVTDFLAKADGYEITLDALNSMQKSVGQVKMSGKNVSSNIRKGTRISLK